MKRSEILLLAILGAFAVTFLFLTRDYDTTAALFPRIIAIASLLFLVLTRIEGRRKNSEVQEFFLRPSILALQAAYVVLIYVIGFFAATLLYLVAAPIQMRYARRGIAVATSVVFTAALAGSFMWIFGIQLPAGALWNMW